MISIMERGYLAPLRSYLFVPAHRENLIPKALATGVDALIMDLEDACPPAEKANGRKGARKAMAGLDWGRVNATIHHLLLITDCHYKSSSRYLTQGVQEPSGRLHPAHEFCPWRCLQ
jgi:hypothetical protein